LYYCGEKPQRGKSATGNRATKQERKKAKKRMTEETRDVGMMAYKIGRLTERLKKGIESTGITGAEFDEATDHLAAAEEALLRWVERNK